MTKWLVAIVLLAIAIDLEIELPDIPYHPNLEESYEHPFSDDEWVKPEADETPIWFSEEESA